MTHPRDWTNAQLAEQMRDLSESSSPYWDQVFFEVAERLERCAAPELLAALQLTQRRFGSFADGWTVLLSGHEMRAIDAAIRQATGQPSSDDASDPHVTDPGTPTPREDESS